MSGNWRTVGSTLVRRGRQVIPFLISGGLIAWLVWSVTPQKLVAAFSVVHRPEAAIRKPASAWLG